MKRKWMVGAFVVAIAAGGVIGAGTIGTGFANDNPNPREESRPLVEQQAPASANTRGQTAGQNSLLSVGDAIAIALEQADGYVESVELERDRGTLYYEVEIENSTKEYDVYVDAYSGEVLRVKEERDRNGDRSKQMKDVLPMTEAVVIANEKVEGTVTKVELDSDDGQLYYEIEIRSGRDEVEVEVDAYTGEILSVDYDD